MARIKMADVAKAAGVSAMTVSRALKQDGRISPETRRRILQVVDRLGYRPDRIAGSLSSQKSGFVGVLVPSLNNPHFAETAAGLQDVLTPAALQTLLGHTNYERHVAERLIETMLERRPEAMIVTYDDHTTRARRLLRTAGIPVVEIWERPMRPIGHVVGFSNRSAAGAMTRHLIETGRTRIAYIGEADDTGTRGAERRKGFIDALNAAGLASHRHVAKTRPPITMMQGREAMFALLDQWPETDAVMCVSDPAAFGALSACVIRGREVPQEIAVAGFGDFEISRASLPAISTISVSGVDIGLQTGRLILDLLGGRLAGAQVIDVPARPIVRGSTVEASKLQL